MDEKDLELFEYIHQLAVMEDYGESCDAILTFMREAGYIPPNKSDLPDSKKRLMASQIADMAIFCEDSLFMRYIFKYAIEILYELWNYLEMDTIKRLDIDRITSYVAYIFMHPTILKTKLRNVNCQLLKDYGEEINDDNLNKAGDWEAKIILSISIDVMQHLVEF